MTVYCSLLHRRIIPMKREGIGRDSPPYTESISGFHESSKLPDANKPPSETVRSLGGLFALLTNT